MPERGSRNYGLVTQKFANQPTYYSTPLVDGHYQSISSLNRNGIWIPGQFRHNSVTMYRMDYVSKPGGTPSQTFGDLKSGRMVGDIAALLSLPGLDSGDVTQQLQAEDFAVNAAIAKSKEPDFDLGIVFAEMGETVSGLLHPMSALTKWVKYLDSPKFLKGINYTKPGVVSPKTIAKKNGSAEFGKQTVDMLSGSWLEWTYGVKPLISTIQDGIAAYNKQSCELLFKLQRSKGSVKFGNSSRMSTVNTYPGYYGVTGDLLTSVRKRQSATAFWMLTKPSTWQAQMGIDATFIPAALWEKTSLSFVVDWFYGIGPWLNAIRPMENRMAIGMSTTLKVDIQQRIHNVRAGLFACPQLSTGSSLTCTTKFMSRIMGSNLPTLLPVVSPKILSLSRQISAVSLAWQRLPFGRR